MKEVETQLNDENIYEEIGVTEKDHVQTVEKGSKLFSNLSRKYVINENENNYYRFNFKKQPV